MAAPSQLHRFRPAVLAILGLAAAYGVYYIYTTHGRASPKATTLRRRNAIRRVREASRDGLQDAASYESILRINLPGPAPDAPLGLLTLSADGREAAYNLAEGQFPTMRDLEEYVGEAFTAAHYRKIVELVVRNIRDRINERISFEEQTELFNRLEGTAFGELRFITEVSRDRDVYIFAFVFRALGIDDDTCNEVILNLRNDEQPSNGARLNGGPVPNGDIAETEFLEDDELSAQNDPGQGLKGLLYHIAEEDARRQGYEHRGIACEMCGEHPIRNIRWHCLNCPDFDLCSTCEASTDHPRNHVFAKIKIPIPVLRQVTQSLPPWYPVEVTRDCGPLRTEVRRHMSKKHDMEEAHIDALHDQFMCVANVPHEGDEDHVGVAIDQFGLMRAMIPDRWMNAPDILVERIFTFYDHGGDGLIDFAEFVDGMAYLRGKTRFEPLRRALDGFDVDGDGYVDRADFLRLMRAKYAIQEKLINDAVDASEDLRTVRITEDLGSSLPISAMFHENDIPAGEHRLPGGKRADAFGDLQPLPKTKTILDEGDPWPQRERSGQGSSQQANSPERLERVLNRWDNLLFDSDEASASIAEASNGLHVDEHPPDDTLGPESHKRYVEQVIEEGLNELLDRIFAITEQEHETAIATRLGREKWRAQIDWFVENDEEIDEVLAAEFSDPLIATAMLQSWRRLRAIRKGKEDEMAGFGGDQFVPTDEESLRQHEAEIREMSLEELLKKAGYEAIDGAEQNVNAERPLQDHPREGKEAAPAAAPPDPTMPQNRPNGPSTLSPAPHIAAPTSSARQPSSRADATEEVSIAAADNKKQGEEDEPPNIHKLRFWANMDFIDANIKERGGPGRLSLDEVEKIVKEDHTDELLGLVKSWLELASF